MNGVIFSSEKCLAYCSPGHPERPERVGETLKHLKKQKYTVQEAMPASEQDLLLAHSKEHIQSVKEGTFYDADTPYFPNIYEIALLSCGSGLQAMESAGNSIPAFSLMRPPGHHAGPLSGISGFCYFNNIAIAVLKALDKFERVAILDIDVHHGNGTQDIVLGNERILFCSLHQVPLYPGTGLNSEKNCINFPLPLFTNEQDYLQVLQNALERIQEFNPELLAVSAGFDTYKKCPLAQLKLEIGTYKKIGGRIACLGMKRFAVLEGGYSNDLPLCIESFLKGFF